MWRGWGEIYVLAEAQLPLCIAVLLWTSRSSSLPKSLGTWPAVLALLDARRVLRTCCQAPEALRVFIWSQQCRHKLTSQLPPEQWFGWEFSPEKTDLCLGTQKCKRMLFISTDTNEQWAGKQLSSEQAGAKSLRPNSLMPRAHNGLVKHLNDSTHVYPS